MTPQKIIIIIFPKKRDQPAAKPYLLDERGDGMEDSQIIGLFEARSPEAIEQTRNKYDALCRSLAGKLLRSEEDVEECVNDTYLALWNTIPPAKPDPLSPYLARIIRNLALKRLEHLAAEKRNADALASFDELEEILSAPGTVEDALQEQALRQAILGFLEGQRKENRILFLRRYFFFDSVKEIARNYGLSESKVKSSLMRTRNKLKAYLIQEGYML